MPRLVLVAIVILGLVIRLAHLHALADTAFPRIPLIFQGSDMNSFWVWAERIRSGDLLGRDTYHPPTDWIKGIAAQEGWDRWLAGKHIFHWAPLYPYWLAGVQSVFHESMLAVLLVQLLVGCVRPLLLYALGRRLFDRRVGLLAAAMGALYGPFVFYEGVVLRDWLATILEPLALVALLAGRESGRRRDWLLAGALFGLALLTKETVLLLVPLVAIWVAWEFWREWRRAIRALACFVAGLAIVISPLVARNAVVGVPLLALSDRATQAVIDGNAVDSAAVGLGVNVTTARGILQRADGSLWSAAVETLRTYHGDYGALVRRLVLKLRGLADPYEVPNNTSFDYGLEISPVLCWTLRYGLVFPVGVAGLLLALPRWRARRLLYLYVLGFLAGQLVGVVLARYRLTIVPVLLVYGAGTVIWTLDALRRGRTGMAATAALLVGVIAVVQHVLLPLSGPEGHVRSQEYLLSARIYAGDDRLDRAVAELDRLHRQPGAQILLSSESQGRAIARFEGDLRVRRAAGLLSAGRREEALRQVQRAELAYEQLAETEPHDAAHNLGVLFLALGDRQRATAYLETFLRFEPEGPRAEAVRRLLGGLTP